MKISKSIRENEKFKKQIKMLNGLMARANGLKYGQPSRFIYKQANKHRKHNDFYCFSNVYLWQATKGNCFFRRMGIK